MFIPASTKIAPKKPCRGIKCCKCIIAAVYVIVCWCVAPELLKLWVPLGKSYTHIFTHFLKETQVKGLKEGLLTCWKDARFCQQTRNWWKGEDNFACYETFTCCFTAFEFTQTVCVSTLDVSAPARFTLVQLFARGWPWGSAPCRHGSSSQFHCHSRMESAPGWEKTNTESSRVIHNAGRHRDGRRRDRQCSIFHFNGCLPPHVQPPYIMLIFRRFCPGAGFSFLSNISCVFPTSCHNTVENIYFLRALCWTRTNWTYR